MVSILQGPDQYNKNKFEEHLKNILRLGAEKPSEHLSLWDRRVHVAFQSNACCDEDVVVVG